MVRSSNKIKQISKTIMAQRTMANAVDILICWGNDDEMANLCMVS